MYVNLFFIAPHLLIRTEQTRYRLNRLDCPLVIGYDLSQNLIWRPLAVIEYCVE